MSEALSTLAIRLGRAVQHDQKEKPKREPSATDR
eukprot:CAMPEP_0115717732 /NCGR_PEP_ID=MMETSP0272-20121206/77031_1 /TAXON_ID=71861 /ORGANISM="Scrippsiella trochoidea, Strain CCMP3099" /LENGTH=33 /DNA_ID= /DNA_START= /DNA_END= /DNA_ORIENTATION=